MGGKCGRFLIDYATDGQSSEMRPLKMAEETEEMTERREEAITELEQRIQAYDAATVAIDTEIRALVLQARGLRQKMSMSGGKVLSISSRGTTATSDSVKRIHSNIVRLRASRVINAQASTVLQAVCDKVRSSAEVVKTTLVLHRSMQTAHKYLSDSGHENLAHSIEQLTDDLADTRDTQQRLQDALRDATDAGSVRPTDRLLSVGDGGIDTGDVDALLRDIIDDDDDDGGGSVDTYPGTAAAAAADAAVTKDTSRAAAPALQGAAAAAADARTQDGSWGVLLATPGGAQRGSGGVGVPVPTAQQEPQPLL